MFDLDDWDLPDKKFYWEGLEHAQFKLDEDTGMIYMKSGTHDGRYHLRFKVYDRKHTQTDVPANVTVTVKTIPHEAVLNSGSVRISGITDEDFIRIWDYKVSLVVVVVCRSRNDFFDRSALFQSQTTSRSKAELFRDKLAHLLNIDRENVDVFSVQLRRIHPPLTDVRFAAHGSTYYKPVRLNGIVLMHREEVSPSFHFPRVILLVLA